MTVEQLNVVISAKTDPIQQKLKQLDKSLGKLEKTTETTTKKMTKSFNKSAFSVNKMKLALIGIGIVAAKAGKAVFSMGADAATVDNQVVALSRTMGNSSGDFVKWAQDIAVDFGISERAAISFGGQFSSIIARTEKNGKAVSDLTQEYLKMGAVIAANTHFEIDDVMGRIRSGLSGRNEAIEDLGIEVKPSVIKGTDAYAAAVIRGGVAWEHMTDAQQASVRAQAILEQAQKRYGTELQGLAGKLAVLKASVENMKLAWGRAFAPIVQFVIPVIQKLVGWLTTAAVYVRAFLGLFFKVSDAAEDADKKTKDFAKSAGGASGAMGDAATGAGAISSGLDKANKAAKKLQRTLFGFDVIHNVAEPEDSSASGGGVGGVGGFEGPDFGDLEPDTGGVDKLFEKIEELQKKMKEFWARVTGLFEQYKVPILTVIGGIAGALAAIGFLALIGKIQQVISFVKGAIGIFTLWTSELGFFGGILDLLAMAFGTISLPVVAFVAVVALVSAALVQLWNTNEGFRNKMIEAWEAIKETIMVAWNDYIKPVFNAIADVVMMIIDRAIMPLWNSWVKLVEYISIAMADLIMAIQPVFQMIFSWLGKILPPIIKTLGEIFSLVFGVISAVVGKAFEVIGAVIAWGIDLLTGLINFLTAIFTGDWEGAWNAVLGIVDNTKKMIQRIWNAIKEFFSDVLGMIKNTIVNVWTNIGEYLGHAMNLIKNVFGVAWEAIKWVISTVLDGIAALIKFVWEGIKAFFVGYFNALMAFYTMIWNGIKVVIEVAMKAIQVVIETIWNIIKAVITTVINAIKTVITTVWETIKVAIQTVLNVIKTIITTIWEWIKAYFVRLFEVYKAMFTTIFNVIKTIIETVMNSIKTIIETIWNVVKTVFSTGLDFIKTIFTAGFNAVKLVVSTVMNSVKTTITTVMDTVKGVFQGLTNFIKGVFTGDWSKAWDGVISIFRNLFGLVPKIFKTAWDTVMKLFSGGGKIFKGFAESVADIFKKLVNSLIKGINTVIGAPFKALNKSFDKFRKISILGAKPFNWLPSIGIPAIPQFAQGGFPEDGLFHANSRELVGKFSNGKTAVANNDQIISGVSTGVANAVRGVLGEGMKSDQPINLTVQIGSETIAKEVIDAVDNYTLKTGQTFKTI